MSEINSFSDYTNKYNSNVDYSALFGGTSNSSSLGGTNILSDYASIKNGSYGKLLKAYYVKQDSEKTAGTGDTSQKLTLMKTSADSLKKSADALNASSLWEKKKIKKKDEETGGETEVEDYDWEAITKAVKSFIEDYNDVVKEAGESNTKDVLRNAAWMTGMTDTVNYIRGSKGVGPTGNVLELSLYSLNPENFYKIHCVCSGAYAANNLYKDLNFATVFINPNTGKLVDIQHINYFYDYATGSNSMTFTRPYSSYTKYYYPYYNGEEPTTW